MPREMPPETDHGFLFSVSENQGQTFPPLSALLWPLAWSVGTLWRSALGLLFGLAGFPPGVAAEVLFSVLILKVFCQRWYV